MRLAVLTAAGVLAAAASASAAGTNVRVSPESGGVEKTFMVGFTAPWKAQVTPYGYSTYTVEALRPAGDGCTRSASAKVYSAPRGARVRVRLRPEGANWCRGRFSGKVVLSDGPICPPPRMYCSARPSSVRTIGRFSFIVR